MIRAEQLWLAVEAVDMRLGIDRLSLKIQESLGALAVRRQRLCFPQPRRQSDQAADLGRHRRLVVRAAVAPRPLHLAAEQRVDLHLERGRMALADRRRRLAAIAGQGA